jgi:hypothetical protein
LRDFIIGDEVEFEVDPNKNFPVWNYSYEQHSVSKSSLIIVSAKIIQTTYDKFRTQWGASDEHTWWWLQPSSQGAMENGSYSKLYMPRLIGLTTEVKAQNICQCSMRDLWNGHAFDCPEKGKTLAKWQGKRYKY